MEVVIDLDNNSFKGIVGDVNEREPEDSKCKQLAEMILPWRAEIEKKLKGDGGWWELKEGQFKRCFNWEIIFPASDRKWDPGNKKG